MGRLHNPITNKLKLFYLRTLQRIARLESYQKPSNGTKLSLVQICLNIPGLSFRVSLKKVIKQ